MKQLFMPLTNKRKINRYKFQTLSLLQTGIIYGDFLETKCTKVIVMSCHHQKNIVLEEIIIYNY